MKYIWNYLKKVFKSTLKKLLIYPFFLVYLFSSPPPSLPPHHILYLPKISPHYSTLWNATKRLLSDVLVMQIRGESDSKAFGWDICDSFQQLLKWIEVLMDVRSLSYLTVGTQTRIVYTKACPWNKFHTNTHISQCHNQIYQVKSLIHCVVLHSDI